MEIGRGRKDFVEKGVLEWRRRSSGTTLRTVEGAATRDGARKRNHVIREAEAAERFLLKGKNVA